MATDIAGVEQETRRVLEHHMAAFATSLDEMMSDYTDASVAITAEATLRGTAAIRGFYEAGRVNANPDAMRLLRLLRLDVVGEVAFFALDARPAGYLLGSDTFVIRDGKILYQTNANLFAGTTIAPAPATPAELDGPVEQETRRVLEQHIAAVAGGVDAIMEDYAEDSVIITAEATHRGRDAIRAATNR